MVPSLEGEVEVALEELEGYVSFQKHFEQLASRLMRQQEKLRWVEEELKMVVGEVEEEPKEEV
jgi:uncharacterized coiled-coil protein SlyX